MLMKMPSLLLPTSSFTRGSASSSSRSSDDVSTELLTELDSPSSKSPEESTLSVTSSAATGETVYSKVGPPEAICGWSGPVKLLIISES